MKVKYKADFYASYMLVEIPEESESRQYSFKMLERNKIAGVLPCKERMEDGIPYLSIDISGKRNLLQEYRDRAMQLEDMIGFFQQLVPILEEMRNYLLTEKMAVLEPEYIYRDIEEERLYIVVLPWERKEQEGLHKLAEFFLEKTDHRDEHGVNAAYRFYKQQSQADFLLQNFIPILEKENILKRQQKKTAAGIKEESQMQENPIRKDIFTERENETAGEWEEEERKSREKRGGGYTGILLILLAAVTFVCSFLPNMRVRKISCQALSLLFLGSGILIMAIQRMHNKKEEAKEEMPEMGFHEWEEGEEERSVSDTVFFDQDSSEELLKLQWKEKGRLKQAVLRDLPCTLGKIKGEVSVVMDHPSVSRVHCRFVEYHTGVAVMDLGSTNGTFLNGIRLKEGEMLEIVKNDEILIGKVKVSVIQ